MVMPLAASNAYADGSAEIVAVCGFDAPDDVPLGLILYGQDGDENNFSIDVTGNGVGTLELESSDWIAVEDQGAHATNVYTIVNGNTLNDQLGIAGVYFTGVYDLPLGPQQFDSNSGTADGAGISLATQINNHPSVNQLVTASYDIAGNTITLTAVEKGPETHSIGFSNTGSFYPTSGGALSGGTHYYPEILPTETTRYSVTTDGTASDGTTYLQKTPLAPTGQTVVLTTEAFRDNPVNLTFQLTGIDVLDEVDYTGAIQQTWTFTYSCT